MRKVILNAHALIHNFQQVKRCAPKSKVLAMIKADAYGHGLVWAAQHLQSAGADAFGVATLDEAVQLRQEGIQIPIVLMDGFLNQAELSEAIALQLTLVLHDASHIDYLEEMRITQPINVWVKIDTGMHRLGFVPDQLEAVYQRLSSLSFVRILGFMTHFSDADDLKKDKTKQQIDLFYQLTSQYSGEKSLANSAGILAWPRSHADWVRPGIMLYGASPFEEGGEILKSVMTVQSNLIAIHEFARGEKIGYGETYACKKKTRIAVVAFGYGDGYPREVKRASVLIKGHMCPLIGRVSMDMLQVDVTGLPDIQLGEVATLWGEGLPVEKLAAAAGTISYDIFCALQWRRIAKLSFDSEN